MEIGFEGTLVIVIILVVALVGIWIRHRVNKKYVRGLDSLAGRLGLQAIESEQIEGEFEKLRLLRAPGFVAHYVENVYVTHRGKRRIVVFKHVMSRMRDSLSESVIAVQLKSSNLPSIRIRPVPAVERYLGSPSPDTKRIRLENDELFDARYYVRGNSENEDAKRLISGTSRKLISQFDDSLSIEVDHGWLLVYKQDKLLSAMEMPRVFDFSLALADCLDSAIS